ncbi:MAG TPA: hypothetical protein VGM03_05410 [Phycisphaerae bacterium]
MWIDDHRNLLTLAFLSTALLALVGVRWVPRRLMWGVFVSAASLAIVTCAIAYRHWTGGWIHVAGYTATGLALLWSWCVLAASRIFQPGEHGSSQAFIFVCHVAALSLGMFAAIVLLVLMMMRLILHIFEIGHGATLPITTIMGFGAGGLAAAAALCLTCASLLRTTRSTLLVTPLFWLIVLTVFWAALLIPAYVPIAGRATPARSAASVALSVGLALVLAVFVVVQDQQRRRARRRALRSDPQQLLVSAATWPGFRASAGAIGLTLIFLSCYHFAAPVEIVPGGYRLTAVTMLLVSAVGGAALFALVHRRWNEDLADAAMGLVSMAACSAAIAFMPRTPELLSDRYPLIFNAVVIALALMTGLWIWLARIWQQQLDPAAAGRAWTTAGHLVRPAARFGFFTAATALLVAFLMTMWPCIPTVATSDDSLGRFVTGLGGYAVLALILIRGARLTGRVSLSALSILSIIGMVAFILVRLLPYASAER